MTDTGPPSDRAYRLYRWFWRSLDWVYPASCGGCGHPGTRWCRSCQDQAQVICPPMCPICGKPLTRPSLSPCITCQTDLPSFKALRSWASFCGTLREALHRLKYRRDIALGDVLSQPMIGMLRELAWPIDIVVPVPLGKTRIKERGYNQVHFLARPIALQTGKPFVPRALIKVRDTASQVGMTKNERRKNIAEAFTASAQFVEKQIILLVDDVTTSGATMETCSRALIQAGALEVYGLTLARSVFDPSV